MFWHFNKGHKFILINGTEYLRIHGVKQISDLFWKVNVLIPVTDKLPKPDYSNPHIHLHFSTIYCIWVLVYETISSEWSYSIWYFLTKFLYVPLQCMLCISSHLFFFIILTLCVDLLITKLPVILVHPVLLPLPLLTSRYRPCNIFLSNTLSLTWSLSMSTNLTLIQKTVKHLL